MCGNPTAPVAAITEEFRKNFLRLNIDSYKTPDFPRKFKPKRLLPHSGPVVRISPMKACLWLLVALLGTPAIAAEGKKKKTELASEFFASKAIPKIKIAIAPDQLATLKKQNRQYVRATITIGDQVLTNSALRLKGMGSFQPLESKPSFAVKFDEFVPDQEHMGLSKLMLNNSSQDGTYLAELIGLSLFRDAGLPVARVTHAYVELNGRDLGLYVVVEAM